MCIKLLILHIFFPLGGKKLSFFNLKITALNEKFQFGGGIQRKPDVLSPQISLFQRETTGAFLA